MTRPVGGLYAQASALSSKNVEVDGPYAPLRAVAQAVGYRAVQSTPLIGPNGGPLGMLSTQFHSVHRADEQAHSNKTATIIPANETQPIPENDLTGNGRRHLSCQFRRSSL